MWAAATLASLAGFIILVLCIPLDVVLHIDVYGRPKFRMRLAWFFGLVSKEITKAKKPEEKKRAVKGKRKPRERRRGARDIFKILRTRGLPGQLTRLLRDILTRLRIRELRANFKVGFDDPADTGLLFSVIGPAIFFLPSSHQIRVQPSFADEAVCEGYLYGTVRLLPIRLVTPCLRFACSLAAIRVVKILVLTKWKRKK